MPTGKFGNQATLPFTRSESYEAALQTLEPAPAGERWWGWISSKFSYGRQTQQTLTWSS